MSDKRHPYFSEAIVIRLQDRIEHLEKQLAAQRAIVAADDEYYRARTDCIGSMAIDAASRVCRERRGDAKRIDEVT